MSLNPHPIVLTTASERRRAELLALAAPARRGRPALASAGCALSWRAVARAVRGMLALRDARVGVAPTPIALISTGR